MSNLHAVENDYSLHDIKDLIKDNINNAAKCFVSIGYYLKYVRDNELFKEDGYSGILEFAQMEFGISKSWASRWMSINDRFSVNGNSPILQEKYRGFSRGKLSEMLYLTDEQLEQVAISATRAEIRQIRLDHVDYTEVDIDKELERREAKLEALQDDGFIEDLRKRAQIKLDAVALLKETVTAPKQPHYCPHCHMLIEGNE